MLLELGQLGCWQRSVLGVRLYTYCILVLINVSRNLLQQSPTLPELIWETQDSNKENRLNEVYIFGKGSTGSPNHCFHHQQLLSRRLPLQRNYLLSPFLANTRLTWTTSLMLHVNLTLSAAPQSRRHVAGTRRALMVCMHDNFVFKGLEATAATKEVWVRLDE